jgi:hypothetical protein
MRWKRWWILACVVAAVLVPIAGERCREAIGQGETCAGLERLSYENDWLLVLIIVAGFIGAGILGRLQDHLESRPCPRCGHRVPNGLVECSACSFDFTQRA